MIAPSRCGDGHQAGSAAAVEKQQQVKRQSNRSACGSGEQAASRDGALGQFIGCALRELRHASGLAWDSKSPIKTLRALRRARDCVDSAIWAAEYDVRLRQRGER
jgi:hypothetical protein